MTTDTSDTSSPAVTATTLPAVPPPAVPPPAVPPPAVPPPAVPPPAVSAVLPAQITAATTATAAAQPPEAEAGLVILGCMVEALDPGLLAEIRATHDRLAALAAEPATPATGPPVAALPVVRRITPLCDRLVHAVAVIDPPSGSGLPDTRTGLAAEPDWLPDAASATNETYERVAQWSGAADLWALVERLAVTHPLSAHPLSPSPPGSSPSGRPEGTRDAPCAARASTKRVNTRKTKTMARAIAAWVKRGGVAP